MTEDQPYQRLEDQIAWYDQKSTENKRWHAALKIVVIIMGASIPFSSGIIWEAIGEPARWISAIAGSIILVSEGIQHVFQYQQHWLNYRATAEALKHEKYLFLGNAGDYRTTTEPKRLLVERTELLISQEHTNWIAERHRSPKQDA